MIKKVTAFATEADLEAAMHVVLQKIFPWLPSTSIRHQTKFSFQFGRRPISVDGFSDSSREARADILLYRGDRPLAVLELKRPGKALTPEDTAQGLSYARMLQPSPPLVIVTNGADVHVLATHTGTAVETDVATQEAFEGLIRSAAKAASSDLREAIETLLGSSPAVLRQAVRQWTNSSLRELTAGPNAAGLPFVSDFLIPRKVSEEVLAALTRGERLVVIVGPPLMGKTSVLRDVVVRTADDDDFAVLFVEASGRGPFQALADALAVELGWPVTLSETRRWLSRVSQLPHGPRLVLAVDGVDHEDSNSWRDIEELTSSAFGQGVTVLMTLDDATADVLRLRGNRRTESIVGRRARQITLDPLDDEEFVIARQLFHERRVVFMKGVASASELRLPWVLREMYTVVVSDPRHRDGDLFAALPSLLSLDLIAQARERFTDPELRRVGSAIARAVLLDSADTKRSVSLTLEALATYVARRETLRDALDTAEISAAIRNGYLKPQMLRTGEAVLVVRTPEFIAGELALLVARELLQRCERDPEGCAEWLVSTASRLPLGDIVCAQAILDAAMQRGGLPLAVITTLVASSPQMVGFTPGTKFALRLDSEMVTITIQEDRSVVMESRGQRGILGDVDDLGTMVGRKHAWLILSHLAEHTLIVESPTGAANIEPAILLQIGSAPVILRQPDMTGILAHEVEGGGQVVCFESGLVEPVTLAILKYLSRDATSRDQWIAEVCRRQSLALVARVDIALNELLRIGEKSTSEWARAVLDGPMLAAWQHWPTFHVGTRAPD